MPGHYGFGEQENPMEMVGHNNAGIQGNLRKVIWNDIPTRPYGLCDLVGYDPAVYDLAE